MPVTVYDVLVHLHKVNCLDDQWYRDKGILECAFVRDLDGYTARKDYSVRPLLHVPMHPSGARIVFEICQRSQQRTRRATAHAPSDGGIGAVEYGPWDTTRDIE